MQQGAPTRSRHSSNAAISGLFVASGLMAAAAISLLAQHVEGANIGAGALFLTGQVVALAILLGSSDPYSTTRKLGLILVAIGLVLGFVAPLLGFIASAVGGTGLLVAGVLSFLGSIAGLSAALRHRDAAQLASK
jgi:hypothetical protein